MLAGAVLVGFGLALVAPWCIRYAGSHWGPRVLAVYPLAVVFLLLAATRWFPATVQTAFPWAPRFGLVWSVLVDGWSVLFALLIAGMGVLVALYAGAYLRHHRFLGRFYMYLTGFTAAMLGVVLASNLLLLFVCWELTSIFSYLLIGFEHEDAKSRKSALQALLTTGVGGLALLVACILLRSAFGTWEIGEIVQGEARWSSAAVELATVLLLLGAAFTKSAQFPFHYWLPAAMAAPTPVSAYLHSATMVKAGVFLLARFHPVFSEHWLWQPALLAFGGTTMLAGALLALPQRDLKLLLAYSTVSALGTLVFLLGIGTEEAAAACVVFLVAHALYKGGLFFFAGIVDHETGTRDVEKLGGLARHWPLLATCAVALALSMGGVIPLFGFIAKELAYEAALHGVAPLGLALLVLCSALQVAVAGYVVVRPLFFRPAERVEVHHAPATELSCGPLVAALASVACSLWPGETLVRLLRSAAAGVYAGPVALELSLWHGWNPTVGLSVLTVVLGALVFVLRPLWCGIAASAGRLARIGPAALYDAAMYALLRLAEWQTRRLQTGKLRQYQAMVLASAVLVLLFATSIVAPPRTHWDWGMFYPTEIAVIVAMLAGMAITILTVSRLTAIAGLGITGYGVGILFLLFGAPDLAMTQFAIETLTVILFVLVLYRLPRFESRSSVRTRIRDALLASAVGGGIAFVVLVLLAQPTASRLAPFFLAQSEPAAHGRNVVNVILVDFRSLDTLGEITVLGLAAIGVGTLMAVRGRWQ
ncbi:MAG: Na(+)/H(+) antiporter subunit A [Candidatus Binatia bacterium]|nr:MAG: Na(+)/H(+) antiporter subunit A [Candidatus Binatia bacterium]